MNTRTNQGPRFNIVSKTNEKHSAAFEKLWMRWQQSDNKLAELARTEDHYLTAIGRVPLDIDSSTGKLLEQQQSMKEQLLQIQAKDISSVCVKLNIWKAIAFAGDVNSEHMDDSERLVFQAIEELNEIRRSRAN